MRRPLMRGLAAAVATAAVFSWLPTANATITASGASSSAATAASAATGAMSAAGAATGSSGQANPYSPAYRHPYRHGVVPMRGTLKLMRSWAAAHPAVQPLSANNLVYGGGIDGIGVTTGSEKVYLVFYGSEWGTPGTDSNGNTTFSGDISGEAPYLQQLFKGLGKGGERWSGVMTQYCDGAPTGAQKCVPVSSQVAYPSSTVLAGVWADESAASPAMATGHQLGTEAVAAAAHFGNTTAAANRNAQYVILSPTGANPDNYVGGGFCAWHDYNGDITLSGGPVTSPYGDIAFTNFPYVTDAGASCGQGFVNSPGTLDGISIVEGHEYAETITDQNPPGGWTDSSGAENGDKCAWITPGTAGGSFDLSLTTGKFAMQTTWANDGASGAGACEASHAIVSNAPRGPIKSAIAHECVDDAGNGSGNGNKVDIFTCNGNPSQIWIAVSDSTLRINGKCMDIIGAKTVNGTRIDIWPCSGHWNQVWQHKSNGEWVNPHSGKCLNDPAYSTKNGTQLIIWTCTDTVNERWTVP
jgi:ricin-type beta-trefoil lectin protein